MATLIIAISIMWILTGRKSRYEYRFLVLCLLCLLKHNVWMSMNKILLCYCFEIALKFVCKINNFGRRLLIFRMGLRIGPTGDEPTYWTIDWRNWQAENGVVLSWSKNKRLTRPKRNSRGRKSSEKATGSVHWNQRSEWAEWILDRKRWLKLCPTSAPCQ